MPVEVRAVKVPPAPGPALTLKISHMEFANNWKFKILSKKLCFQKLLATLVKSVFEYEFSSHRMKI